MTTPRVHTYHCTFCSHLVLASTYVFDRLPRRRPPGLDKAIIVPLPPRPKTETEDPSALSSSDSSDSSDSEREETPPPAGPGAPVIEDNTATKGGAGGMPPPRRGKLRDRERHKRDKDSYTVLLTLQRDRAAKVITREDGFEKRYLWRCGRCRLVVGYQLDELHYELGPRSDTHPNTVIVGGGEAGAGKDRVEKERRRRERERGMFFYVLPGAVVESEALGTEPRKEDVELGAVE